MKVLHLWNSDSARHGGGGAVAMSRLHSSLSAAGIHSKILCKTKTSESPDVLTLRRFPRLEIIEKILRIPSSRIGLNDIHRISTFKIQQHEAYVNTDLLHIHGTHGNFMSYLALPALTTAKPAVFTLHDMWAFTGHCGYSFDCDRWKIGCGKCPHLDAAPAVKRDATRLEWKLKNWIYGRSNLTIICPSKWLEEQAKQSPLTNRFPVHYIPHGIDTEAFQPLDPELCRSQLGIPPDKKVLMFAAARLNNYRKGGDLLVKALQSLPKSLKAETVLLVIGKEGKEIAENIDIPVYDLGYLSDDRSKAVAYSAADLFLFPTRADIFGLVSIESQACGTPVVSFKVGAVPEHVLPGITGYLAEPENAQDFCDGIVELLEDESQRNFMSQHCRANVLKEYSLKLHIQRHIHLYQALVC